MDLDFTPAKERSLNNMYVKDIRDERSPGGVGSAKVWDRVDFTGGDTESVRRGGRRVGDLGAGDGLRSRALVDLHARARDRALDQPERTGDALEANFPCRCYADHPRTRRAIEGRHHVGHAPRVKINVAWEIVARRHARGRRSRRSARHAPRD